jgi:predicted RNA-binding Zn-ribbon protein involved in translation (DUF1610 family)
MAIGVNVSALSFIDGSDILKALHYWESKVRWGRNLTKPALIAKPDSLGKEIQDAVDFALAHLHWSAIQDWFEDFADDVAIQHATGKSAAKVFAEKMRSISCPADTQDGLICGANLKINDEKLTSFFTCPKCGSEWTAVRLMDVALSTPGAEVWVDREALAVRLGIKEKEVTAFAKRHAIATRGQMVEVRSFLAARKDVA